MRFGVIKLPESGQKITFNVMKWEAVFMELVIA
jgi:hypothetical protein